MDVFEFTDVSIVRAGGVYLLLKGDRVVYVGQSRRLIVRLYQHQHAAQYPKHRYPGCPKPMIFDRIKVLQLPLDQFDRVERDLIAHYRPFYNISPGPAPKQDLATLIPALAAPPPPTPLFTRRI